MPSTDGFKMTGDCNQLQITTDHIKAMMLDFKGFSRARIAKRLQKSISTINHWMIDPDFKEEYRNRITDWAREFVKDEIGKSLRTLVEVRKMYRVVPGAARLAAKDILDIAGFTAEPAGLLEGTISEIVSKMNPRQAREFVLKLFRGFEGIEDGPFRGALLPMGNDQV